MKQNDAVLNLRIATELHEQLKALAQTKYMPLSVMVRLALMDYIKQEAPTALSSQTLPAKTYMGKPMSKMTDEEIERGRQARLRQLNNPQAPSTQIGDQQFQDDWL